MADEKKFPCSDDLQTAIAISAGLNKASASLANKFCESENGKSARVSVVELRQMPAEPRRAAVVAEAANRPNRLEPISANATADGRFHPRTEACLRNERCRRTSALKWNQNCPFWAEFDDMKSLKRPFCEVRLPCGSFVGY